MLLCQTWRELVDISVIFKLYSYNVNQTLKMKWPASLWQQKKDNGLQITWAATYAIPFSAYYLY